MVQEDPKDFLGDIDNLLAPNAIGTRLVDRGDESKRLGVFMWSRVAEIRANRLGARYKLGGRGGGKVPEDESHDDSTSAELAWAFLLLIKKHAKQGREEIGLDLRQPFEGEICRTQGF